MFKNGVGFSGKGSHGGRSAHSFVSDVPVSRAAAPSWDTQIEGGGAERWGLLLTSVKNDD